MTQTLQLETLTLPNLTPATDVEIVAYLHRSCKIAEIAASAEQDAFVLKLCEQLGITITDQEWQAAGDAFRLEHNLPGIAETQAWFAQQRVTVEEWSQGIKISLLNQKLKEHLFGATVDAHYMSNRHHYRQVALSQILVTDLTEALKIAQALRQDQASFCALALTYSKGKQSQENGGFVGVRYLSELSQDIVRAIADAKEGEILGPIHTKFGYHILRVEKWFPVELNQSVREAVLEAMFHKWLRESGVETLNH